MMKLLRLMMRERSACSDCDFTEPALRNFTRMLLKPTEHTWGLHGAGQGKIWDNALLQVREKTAAEIHSSLLLAVPSLSWQSIVFIVYYKAQQKGSVCLISQATLAAPTSPAGADFAKQEASWLEQRLFASEYAVAALIDAPRASPSAKALGERIHAEMAAQWPVAAPDMTGYVEVPAGTAISTTHFTAVVPTRRILAQMV